jgi:hypothetical protein
LPCLRSVAPNLRTSSGPLEPKCTCAFHSRSNGLRHILVLAIIWGRFAKLSKSCAGILLTPAATSLGGHPLDAPVFQEFLQLATAHAPGIGLNAIRLLKALVAAGASTRAPMARDWVDEIVVRDMALHGTELASAIAYAEGERRRQPTKSRLGLPHAYGRAHRQAALMIVEIYKNFARRVCVLRASRAERKRPPWRP